MMDRVLGVFSCVLLALGVELRYVAGFVTFLIGVACVAVIVKEWMR